MLNNVNITGAAGACHGVVVETGTDAITGKFYAIQVLADATFSTFTENGSSGDVMTGFAVPAGTVIYNGLGITAFTLTSGKVRAYKLP
jgi:delta-aminolevulinic acid dehydratase/porphobilinogen synthase